MLSRMSHAVEKSAVQGDIIFKFPEFLVVFKPLLLFKYIAKIKND